MQACPQIPRASHPHSQTSVRPSHSALRSPLKTCTVCSLEHPGLPQTWVGHHLPVLNQSRRDLPVQGLSNLLQNLRKGPSMGSQALPQAHTPHPVLLSLQPRQESLSRRLTRSRPALPHQVGCRSQACIQASMPGCRRMSGCPGAATGTCSPWMGPCGIHQHPQILTTNPRHS